MNKSQRKTLVKIFQEPVATDIRWNEIENLFVATGAKISEGYIGQVEFDDEADIFHGDVINTRAVITFQGTTVPEIKAAFRDSVEDYLAFCAELGEEPEKPFSGELNLKLPPQVHRAKLNCL